MPIPPSVTEVQEAITQHWSHVLARNTSPPHVTRTLVFYSQEDGLEAFAVVDADGGDCFPVGGWEVGAINQRADLARESEGRSVGSPISIGRIKRLLVSTNGQPLLTDAHGQRPQDYEGWVAACAFQEELAAHWRQTIHGHDGLRAQLLTRRTILHTERHKLQVFPELNRHTACVQERLLAQEHFEDAFQALLDYCNSTPLPVTPQHLDYAVTESQSLRQQLEQAIELDTQKLRPLQGDHARLQNEVWQQAAFSPSGQGSLGLTLDGRLA